MDCSYGILWLSSRGGLALFPMDAAGPQFRFPGNERWPGYKARPEEQRLRLSEKMGLLTTVVAVAAGAGGTVALAPVVLGAVGFTSVGIAAGSYAAGMMSTAAIANGGGVAAGSLVSVLTSVGMGGLGTTATATLATVGGSVGAAVAALI